MEQTEREPLQLRAGFANAVKALEKEYYDQARRNCEDAFPSAKHGACPTLVDGLVWTLDWLYLQELDVVLRLMNKKTPGEERIPSELFKRL